MQSSESSKAKKAFVGKVMFSGRKNKLKFGGDNYTLKLDKGKILSKQPIVKINEYSIILIGKILDTYNKFDLKNQEKTIVRLYKKYENKLATKLEGEYLIILYNNKTKVLKIFNNRYEATNFYYYLDKNLFVFADTLKNLLHNLPIKPEFDLKSIPTFLDTGFSSTEKLPLLNTYRLLPTQVITVKENHFESTDNWKFEFNFNRKPFNNPRKKITEYETLFRNSIKSYIKKYNPKSIGLFLSGGHDTSFVYLETAEIFKKPIHTFTAHFKGFGFDETPKAKYVTELKHGTHHTIEITPEHLDYIPELVWAMEEPIAGASLPAHIMAKEAQKYVDVIFTGDPGDTLWGEYYPVAEWHKYLKYLPYLFRKLLHLMSKTTLKISDWERLWELEHMLWLFSEKDLYKNFMERLCTYRHFRDDYLEKILNKDVFENIEKNSCGINVPFNRKNFDDMLIEAKMLYGVYVYNLPLNQKTVEYHNLNFYAPYLNKRLFDFINSLPHDWLNSGSSFQKLTNQGIKRKFHKMTLMKHLPKRFVFGMQQSFDVPWHTLFNNRPKILKNLLRRLKNRGWYNNKALENLFEEFPNQEVSPHEIIQLQHHGYRIYSLLLLEVWSMLFLDDFKNKKPKKMPLEEFLA